MPKTGFPPFVCACFTLNYIVGTGFLALPWAFYQAGWFFSSIAMVFVCAVANLGSDFLLSAMARAERLTALLEEKEDDDAQKSISLAEIFSERQSLVEAVPSDEAPAPPVSGRLTEEVGNLKRLDADHAFGAGYGSTTPILRREASGDDFPLSSSVDASAGNVMLVCDRQFDVPELCQIFLGHWGFKAYAICVSLYLYGALWSFTSVFGSALELAVPAIGQRDSYAFFILAFSLIVVPMSFLELSEQKVIQIALSGCRIVMITIMILTPIFAAFCEGKQSHDYAITGSPHFDDQFNPTGAPSISISGLHRMFPIMVYAAVFHFSIPALAGEVTEKSQLGTVFGLTFVLCGSLYACIGAVDAFYFGDGVAQSSNLNWGVYHGGTGRLITDKYGQSKWIDVALWARAISFFVVIFPAINVISAFPLHALSLGNSLMGIYYGDKIHEIEQNRTTTVLFRAISCVPPLVGGLFVRDLGTITDYTGLSGLAIAFCFPALLYISSEKKFHKMGIPSRTHYERLGSSVAVASAVLIFGAVSIIGVLSLLVSKG